MKRWRHIFRQFGARLQDEAGGVLIEFGIVVSLFMFLFASLLDFGRLAYGAVMAQKATQLAARIAAVRPPACSGVPQTNLRGTNANAPRFGTSCSAAAGVCATAATVSCTGSDAPDCTNANDPLAAQTDGEIWCRVKDLMPYGTTIDALEFSYSFDSNLGFLGGPYTPMVTVSLDLPDFQFVSPLAMLAVAAGASSSAIPASIGYKDFSVSLPGEDLASGDSG